jgi:hypothetical protein
VLQTAVAADEASLILKSSDVVRLTKLSVRPKLNLAVLLFRRSNPDAANPIFEHSRTRRLRPSDKGPDEAVAVSAHLFIQISGIADAAHRTYPAILEEVPGLSRTYIQALLHDILKGHRYAYTDRRGEEKETHTIVEFHGKKSERVSGALEGQSVVPTITLVRPGNIEGLDTEGLVAPRDERMKLVLKATSAQTLDIIRKIQSWMGRHHWSSLLVEMNMPEQRKRIGLLASREKLTLLMSYSSAPSRST